MTTSSTRRPPSWFWAAIIVRRPSASSARASTSGSGHRGQADGAGEDHLRADEHRQVGFVPKQIDDHPALAVVELAFQQRRRGKRPQDQARHA